MSLSTAKRPNTLTLKGVATVAGATLGMAIGFGCLALTSVFIAPLGAEFGWTKSQLSTCYTLAAVGMAFGGVFWGRVSDWMDVRFLLALGGAFIFLPLFAMSQATALWQFYLANLLLGIAGFGCLYTPLVSAAGEWFENRRGLVMGVVTAGGALGQGVMPYTASALISATGWRSAFFGIAAGVLAVQIVIWFLVRRRDATANHSLREAAASAPPRLPPRLWALAFAAFFCCACMGVPLVHLAGFVSAVFGSPSLGATSMLVAMVSGAVGRICFGLIADRSGNLPAYALASLIQTVCILVFPTLQSALPILALSAVFGFGFAGNMTCLILCVRDEAPERAFGTAIGVVMFIAWAGMGVGGYLGGAFFDLTGRYTLAFLAAAAFGVGNLLLLAGLAMTGGGGSLFLAIGRHLRSVAQQSA